MPKTGKTTYQHVKVLPQGRGWAVYDKATGKLLEGGFFYKLNAHAAAEVWDMNWEDPVVRRTP